MADSSDKPIYHVAPLRGWVNDPNGPIMYQGKYHLFYQHLPEGCEWAFGLVWGHSVSSDLIHWEHLPHAVVPTASSLDADGCFSGCAAIDTDGTPVILYTGVRLRTNPDAAPLPPPECDLNLPFIEAQLFATPVNKDDHLLLFWEKEPKPFIGLPPPSMNLTGWRDPFVVERPCEANGYEWVVLMGSGIKEVGGATIVYRTQSLRDASSWRYDGLLCVGDGDTGAVWECPLIAQLSPLPLIDELLGSSHHSRMAMGPRLSRPLLGSGNMLQQLDAGKDNPKSPTSGADADGPFALQQQQQQVQQHQQQEQGPHPLSHPNGGIFSNGSSEPVGTYDERYTHFYSISPDACTNPTIYWLGRYAAGRFDLDNAIGPLRLDLGDVLYAPNVMRDDKGRLLLWGWLQERRTVGTYDYAGCMTVPRLLHLDHDRLHQTPAPELLSLRKGESWQATHVRLSAAATLTLPGVVGSSRLDIEAVFSQGSASTVGIFLRSWNQAGEGGAAVLYNWESNLLEVVFEALDPATMTFSLTAPMARRIGGPITHKPGQPLALRLLLDGSCVEIFTGSGEVLSTRIYRGAPAHDHADAGIEFVALDGEATLERVAAYEMISIYPAQPTQWPQAVTELEGLDLDGMIDGVDALGMEQQQQATDGVVLGRSLTLEKTMSDVGINLVGSLREQQLLERILSPKALSPKALSPRMSVNADLSDKLQQMMLSPRAATAALAPPAAAEMPLEEEMTADIFGLEAF